jgi:hypothetical protein
LEQVDLFQQKYLTQRVVNSLSHSREDNISSKVCESLELPREDKRQKKTNKNILLLNARQRHDIADHID